MTKRRYGEDEVREIFSLATTGGVHDPSLPSDSGGLTLEELQRIGQEAGIEPAQVAQGAEKLDSRGSAIRSHSFAGAPGVNGELRIYPKSGYVVAVLSNLDPPTATQVSAFLDVRLSR